MRFLLDEMFPPRTCGQLVERGHDAVHVRDLGLDTRPEREVAAAAACEDRALVTENVKDFAVGGYQPGALRGPALAEDRALTRGHDVTAATWPTGSSAQSVPTLRIIA